jgi:hypothetical protein
VRCGYGKFWVFIVFLGVRYSSLVYVIKAVCGRGRVPRCTLEDVELVEVRSLCMGHTLFTSGVGSA